MSPDQSNTSIVYINFDLVDKKVKKNDFYKVGLTDDELFAHELKHAYDNKRHWNNRKFDKSVKVEGNEIEAVKFENIVRKENNHKRRTLYGGKDISSKLDK